MDGYPTTGQVRRESVEQIVDTFGRFTTMGSTRLELMGAGDQDETIEGFTPVIAALSSGV